MAAAFPHLKLAHYRNQLLYWFLPESICLLCLVEHKELPLTELKRLFINVCMALGKEFVLPQVSMDQVRVLIIIGTSTFMYQLSHSFFYSYSMM